MSWFKSKEPRPEIGQYQIVEVTTGGGDVTYHVQQYQWGRGYTEWRTSRCFIHYGKALDYIREQRSREVVSRRVVWP